MSDYNPGPVTQLLIAANNGNQKAREQLWQMVYQRLHQLARVRMKGERYGHSLSTTALVHEVYLQLDLVVDQVNTDDRNHFFALACKIMRQVLIEHARGHQAKKRKGQKVNLDDHIPQPGHTIPPEDLLALDRALTNLESQDPRLGQVVECKFFGGLTTAETATIMATSTRSVERHWQRAKAYLYRALRQQPNNGGSST